MTWRDGFAIASVLLASFVAARAFLALHVPLSAPQTPSLSLLRGPSDVMPPIYGWWSWYDQERYLKSALA